MGKSRVKLQGYIDSCIFNAFVKFKHDMGITSDSYALGQLIGSALDVDVERIPATALEKVIALFERVATLESKLEYTEYILKQKCSP